jgi:flagellar protein FliO/FliZ
MTKLNPLSRAVATATVALGACLLALACPHAVMAKGTTAAATGAGENTPLDLSPVSTGTHTSSSGASIVRTIVGLAIVIAVIWGLSWILRQVKTGRDPQLSSAGLSSVAALTLSTGRSVHLVRAGSDYVLLGSAEQGVVPIYRYSEQEAREAGLLDVVDEPTRPRRQLLKPAGALLKPPIESPAGRHDPMRMPAPGGGVVDRLRELTVRR